MRKRRARLPLSVESFVGVGDSETDDGAESLLFSFETSELELILNGSV